MVKAATAERYANSRAELLASDVGQRIRTARQERGMSLADVGQEDLSRSFLSLVELGRSRISLRALAIVADRLELPLSYFLDSAAAGGEAAIELTLDLAEAALSRQQPEEALRSLDEVTVSRPQRERERWLRGRALVEAERPRDAIPVLQEGLRLAERIPGDPLVVHLAYELGVALYNARNHDEALIHLRRALQETSTTPEDPILLGKITVMIGHVHYVRGEVGSAIEQYERAREIFGAMTDLNTLGCVYSGLSLAYKRSGDVHNALRYSKLSVASFEAKRNARESAQELNNLAVHYAELDDLENAEECAGAAVERARRVDANDVEAIAHSTLASVHLRREEEDSAEAEARAADELAPDDENLARIHARVVLGKLAERRGDQRQADEFFHEVLGVLRRTNQQAIFADTALGYSLLLRQRGETDRALEFALEAAQAKAFRS